MPRGLISLVRLVAVLVVTLHVMRRLGCCSGCSSGDPNYDSEEVRAGRATMC